MFQFLSQFTFIGWPVAAIGVIGLILAFVLIAKQRGVEQETEYDDPADDPTVQTLSSRGRLSLWLGAVFLIVGVLLLVSPAWATII